MGVITYTSGTTALVAKTRNHRVRLWGGGAAGGGVTGTGSTNGGGSGGQFVQSRRALTPASSYNVVIGGTATGSTSATVAGNDTTFNATDVVAKGGVGVASNGSGSTTGNAGATGSTTGGVGDSVTAGGNGGNAPNTTTSGGGGG